MRDLLTVVRLDVIEAGLLAFEMVGNLVDQSVAKLAVKMAAWKVY